MRTISHYRILEKLGSGGMGEVHLAEDLRLGRKVAIKLLPPQFTSDPSRLRRFESEARAVSALNHPNILTIFEIGETAGEHFLAVEYIDGETLRSRLRRGPMKREEIAEIAGAVAAALAEAHSAGVVHRDIKPENIMIRRDGLVKVLDFGLAKRSESVDGTASAAPTEIRATDPGTILGTVTYMSPEQARGLDVDSRSDLFSLGAVIYEMLTGRTPFEGKTTTDTLAAIIGSEPQPITRFNADAPSELRWITEKALHKDRDERYQSAREMAADLRRLGRSSTSAVSASGAQNHRDTITSVSSSTGPDTAPTTTVSSAEYILSGIRKHRVGAGVALALAILAVLVTVFLASRETPVDSIAVLPFAYGEDDSDSEYLADGLTESLINSLSKIRDLRVIPRSLVFSYKGSQMPIDEIAGSLGARAVVTGRVIRSGDRVDIQADLVDIESRAQLWGDRFSGTQADVMDAHQRITQAISSRLRPAMGVEERGKIENAYAHDSEAYDLYLKANYLWNRRRPEDIQRAVELYERAIDRDPEFALAWAGLANAYTVMPNYTSMPPSEAFPKVKQAARRALEINPDLAEAHAALAGVLFAYDFKPAEAEREFLRAIELDPQFAAAHYWYSEFLTATLRNEEALVQAKAAVEADPVSIISALCHIGAQLGVGDIPAAEKALKTALEIDPDFPMLKLMDAFIRVEQGRIEEAAQKLDEFSAIVDDQSFRVAALELRGEHAEAVKLTEELEERALKGELDSYSVASSFGMVKSWDKALHWLDRAYEDRATSLSYILRERTFEPIYGDPRFRDLLRRLGLPMPDAS